MVIIICENDNTDSGLIPCFNIVACESSNVLILDYNVFDIGLWCNGSTIDFGSISLSSNLGSPTSYINPKKIMSIYKSIDVAITNVKRLNNLKAKRRLTKEETELFNLYKTILKCNDTGVYTSEVKDIIYSD